MGAFKFEFNGVGGHGCERSAKEGEKFIGCKSMRCPDCLCKEFTEKMRAAGFMSSTPASAVFTHWPGDSTQVVDDLGSDPLWSKRTDNDFFNSKNAPKG